MVRKNTPGVAKREPALVIGACGLAANGVLHQVLHAAHAGGAVHALAHGVAGAATVLGIRSKVTPTAS